MNHRIVYAYAVLRYLHDVVSGERLNVGVVVLSPTSGKLIARFAPNLERVVGAFPSASHSGLKAALASIESRIDRVNATEGMTLPDLLARVLPPDDSSFQWSEPGSGVTIDINSVLEELHERFVTRHARSYSEPLDALQTGDLYAVAPGWTNKTLACNDLGDWQEIEAAAGGAP